jgi:hypothetical protein
VLAWPGAGAGAGPCLLTAPEPGTQASRSSIVLKMSDMTSCMYEKHPNQHRFRLQECIQDTSKMPNVVSPPLPSLFHPQVQAAARQAALMTAHCRHHHGWLAEPYPHPTCAVAVAPPSAVTTQRGLQQSRLSAAGFRVLGISCDRYNVLQCSICTRVISTAPCPHHHTSPPRAPRLGAADPTLRPLSSVASMALKEPAPSCCGA